MSKKLFIEAIIKFTLGIILVGLLIFLPAGTIDFFGGWLLLAILFVPMLFAGIVMMIKNPSLLAKRLDAKEKSGEQGLIVALSGLMFVAGFVMAGIDFRFKLLPVPTSIQLVAAALFLIGYALYAVVLCQNTYLSRTIEVQENQSVIDTGLYSVVRHPMYSATVLLFLAMPLVLGSLLSFAMFLFYPFLIAARIKSEESFLEKELEGYLEYEKKVKYRLIPFVW